MDLKDEHLIEKMERHLSAHVEATTRYLREDSEKFLNDIRAAKDLAEEIPTINDMIIKAEHVFVVQSQLDAKLDTNMELRAGYRSINLGSVNVASGKYRFVVAMFRVED
jgi:hypothetical protein